MLSRMLAYSIFSIPFPVNRESNNKQQQTTTNDNNKQQQTTTNDNNKQQQTTTNRNKPQQPITNHNKQHQTTNQLQTFLFAKRYNIDNVGL